MINNNISFVIPVYNEKQNIRELVFEIINLESVLKDYEIIIVDDGSTEDIYSEIRDIKNIVYIRHKKNLGQGQAMVTGINASRFDLIATMDGDLQNDPADLLKMYKTMIQKKTDMVCGYRKNRKDPFLKKISSRIANFFRNILLGDKIYDSGCTLKIFKKNAISNIRLDKNFFMFMPIQLQFAGFKVDQCEVLHRARIHGVTKYSYISQMFTGASYIFYLFFERIIKYRENNKNVLMSLSVAITSECNLKCEYCNIHKEKIQRLSFKYLKEVFDSIQKKIYIVTFTGGEPLLHPEIAKILSCSKDLFKINLNTNGTNTELLKKYACFLDYCHISVNSLEEYKNKSENINICINENVVPVIVFTAHSKNFVKKDILQILDLLPVQCKIAFDTLYNNSLTPQNRYLVLNKISEKDFWEFILMLKTEYKNKIMNSVTTIRARIERKSVKCTAWKNSLYLHYNKYIYPCSTALVKGKRLDLPKKIFAESDFSPYIRCKSCKCGSFLEMHYLQRLEPNLIYQNIRQLAKELVELKPRNPHRRYKP